MKTGDFMLGSVAIIVDGNGRVLLGERIHRNGKGSFGVPGGHVEIGEHPRLTAIRETLEETDLSLDVPGVLLDGCPAQYATNEPLHVIQEHWFILFYRFDLRGRDIRVKNLDKKNTKSWDWHALDSLPQPLFGPLSNILEEMRKDVV